MTRKSSAKEGRPLLGSATVRMPGDGSSENTGHGPRLGRESPPIIDSVQTLAVPDQQSRYDYPHTTGMLNTFSNTSIAPFEQQVGMGGDLEHALMEYRDAVDLPPPAHGRFEQPAILHNPDKSFRAHVGCLEEQKDLDDAISALRDAVRLTPRGHPGNPGRLINLGDSLLTRFQRLGEPTDIEDAIVLYSHAAYVPIGPIGIRFDASQKWIACAQQVHHRSLLRAHAAAIALLPQLAWVGLSLTSRCRELARGADVVREAAAAALDSGLPELAVEWLEQGRSIVWGEFLQLRSSYEDLLSAYPDHARRLRELSVALDEVTVTHEQSLPLHADETQSARYGTTESLHQENRRRTLAIARDQLLREVQRFPGFERFPFQEKFSELRVLAGAGPVVILNAAESHCDALIILADVNHAIHVPLPDFTVKRSIDLLNSMRGCLRQACTVRVKEREGGPVGCTWESCLSSLWKCVVKPVLDALAFPTSGDPSRIFWCPTGPLVFLPIHAAGLYGTKYSQPGHKVYDFVVSSYIPALAVLAPSLNPAVEPSSGLRLFVVRQPSSDGQPQLPGVQAELEYIKEAISNSPLTPTLFLESSLGTVEEVLDLMKQSDWVHFACRGIQDAPNPINSGLCLAGGRRLRLRDIIALSRPHGGLAYLSASQTATGDECLPDEAIHIAAGMLLAGYAGVIGTMWSISDTHAPGIARDVYKQLLGSRRGPDYRDAARALHDAIGRLRESGATFDEWVPFIHVGL